MIAYNKTALRNATIQEEAADALQDNLLSAEEYVAIKTAYPVSLYSPNMFIRVGLFALTLIICLFSFGLLGLLFLNNIEHGLTGLAIFFALITYLALELFVRAKKHYRSGVDDALLWATAIALFPAIGFDFIDHFNGLALSIIVFCISTYFSLRFADKLMAVCSALSLTGILFFSVIELGNTGKAIIPFVIMAFAGGLFILVQKIRSPKLLKCYTDCLDTIEIVTLLLFYTAGNYFVVRELSNQMFGLSLEKGQGIPFGWLFWILTVMLPLVYIYAGIIKKNTLFLRTGLLLVAVAVFTIRYYHSILSVEIAMVLGGSVLVVLAWALIRYLQEPKYGFTYLEQRSNADINKPNIESLLIAETFSQQPGQPDKTEFGGGSFGGGGATGEY